MIMIYDVAIGFILGRFRKPFWNAILYTFVIEMMITGANLFLGTEPTKSFLSNYLSTSALTISIYLFIAIATYIGYSIGKKTARTDET